MLYLLKFVLLFNMAIAGVFAAAAAGAHNTSLVDGAETTRAVPKVLSRHKRYLAFPEGSSVSAAICLTVGVIGNPDTDWLSWAVNWGVAYDLPNHNWVRQHVNGFANLTKAMLQRRSRRSFYSQVHTAFEHMGFNGQACVERALCESAMYLQGNLDGQRQRGNMVEELLRVVLTLPAERVAEHEPEQHHHYDGIYRRSRRGLSDCKVAYPGCQFSLLDLALGKYAMSPTKLTAFNFM